MQHLAAITRDDKVAPHVGLIWTPERGDVYGYVCKATIERIQNMKYASTDRWLLEQWLSSNLMDRSLTKTPVMTRSYGSTLYGIKDGVQDFIDDKKMTEHFNDAFIAGNWMGQQIWDSMTDSLRGPMAFMEWVQQCAEILAKANKPLIWTNPMGSRCIQSPMKTKKKRVEVKINGRTVQYQIQIPTNKINVSKSESSSSPNIIHGCDASHLCLTGVNSMESGIKEFAMVHDSFGTVPDSAELLLFNAKKSWVDMYSTNWMNVWYEQWCSQLGSNDIPKPPKMGNLNISDVWNSDFFFA